MRIVTNVPLDDVRRGCPNLIIERPQHLLDARVGNRRFAEFAKCVQAFDDQAEHQIMPRCSPDAPICCAIGHLIPDDLQDIGIMGPSRNGVPQVNGCVVVCKQRGDQMLPGPVGIRRPKIRQTFDPCLSG